MTKFAIHLCYNDGALGVLHSNSPSPSYVSFKDLAPLPNSINDIRHFETRFVSPFIAVPHIHFLFSYGNIGNSFRSEWRSSSLKARL